MSDIDHDAFATLLRNGFNRTSSRYRRICLPSRAQFRVSGNHNEAQLWLSEASVLSNMQTDSACFEAWTLALLTWCGLTHVSIDWVEPSNRGDGHYQRYLYRLEKFAHLLGPRRFTVVKPERLGECMIRNSLDPVLNVPMGADTALIESVANSEAALEKRLAGANQRERMRLMAAFDLIALDRQVPMGVFDSTPSRATGIFAHGKSAVDLLGLDSQGAIWLFELKAHGNTKIGALSELFFYSMLLQDVRLRRMRFHTGWRPGRTTIAPDDIVLAPRLHARLLAPSVHPLLGPEVFVLLTRCATTAGWPIDYTTLDLAPFLGVPAVSAVPSPNAESAVP